MTACLLRLCRARTGTLRPTSLLVAKLATSIFIIAGTVSCQTISLEDLNESNRYFLGLTVLRNASANLQISAIESQVFGVSVADGMTLGWSNSERVYVPLRVPANENEPYEATCGIVVIIHSPEQLRHAEQLLSGLEGENICLTNFD